MALTGSGKGIQIIVGADYNDKQLRAAQRDLDRLKQRSAAAQGPLQKLGGTIRSNLGPALAMAAAAAGAMAVKMGVDGVKAAIADQKTVEVLAQTLENLGEAHKQAGVEDFIAALESATGVADESLRPALGKLAIATGDVDEAQRRLEQAMDISIGTGQSLDGIVMALSRSLATGTKGSLSRYGIIIDDNTLKTEGFGAALDEAAGQFAGLADREAKTLEGRLRILTTEFDNLKEAFGYGFLNGLGETGQGMDDLAGSMRDLEPAMEDLGETVGDTFRMFIDAVKWITDARTTIGDFIDELGEFGHIIESAFGNSVDPISGMTKHVKILAGALTGNVDSVNAALNGAEESTGKYWSKLTKATGATQEIITPTQELIDELEAEADATEKAAAEFDKLADAISRTNAVTAYQSAIDDLRKTLKDTKNETSIFNSKGRESVEAYVDLADNAGKYIESLDSTAQKVSTAQDVLGTLKDALANTKMDPATRAALIEPFQALIDDLEENNIEVGTLQEQLDNLKSKTITTTVKFDFPDGRPPGGWPREWYGAKGGMVPQFFAGGGAARGPDTVPAMLAPGEFVMRRSAVKQFGADVFSQLNRGINPLAGMTPSAATGRAGLSIGSITVQSAPGEAAAESLPRALRRMSFLAGV